jgi:tetratricopeptide (TPR) repeat protein
MPEPAQIGPYRLMRRLGAGGMGEVFLALDERLERNVAVKRIRGDSSPSAERRERFRREARIAARLNHPAIVQIYDVLKEEDSDAIVMELVDGCNLRRRLDAGPLNVPTALQLALDVAGGLEAAHAQGIVHRDLKSENILVTPAGRAKIADFGIAKSLLTQAATALTREGHVVGTYRAMSPEQARGQAVDARSDLFSLGVLLYESLAGHSPFEGENELATLNRIVRERQRPLREVNAEVPPALSNLVDNLLEKDPLLRPRSAGEVARTLREIGAGSTLDEESTVLERVLMPTAAPILAAGTARGLGRPARAWIALGLLLAVAAIVFFLVSRPPRRPLYVAVIPPEVRGQGLPEAPLVKAAVRSALAQTLISLEGISPKDADEGRGLPDSPAQLARAVAADELVRARLDCRPESCTLSLDRIRGGDGGLLASRGFSVPTDNLGLLAGVVASQVRQAYAGFDVREGSHLIQASDRDLRDLLRLRRRFDAREDLTSVVADLEGLRRRSPSFFEAYLLEADVLRYRFYTSRDAEDVRRAIDLTRQARSMAPQDPQPDLRLADIGMAANRPELMEEAIARLRALIPGDARLLQREANLLTVRGRTREALEVLRQAARVHPSAKRLATLAQMEIQAGEVAAARGHVEQLLQRAPDYYDGLSILAMIELFHGDPGRAADLYSRLVIRSPGLEELSNLGFALLMLGRYTDAASVYERVLEREPDNPLFTLNLADTYQITGRTVQARALYLKLLMLMEADPSASTPQYMSAKAQALAHLRRGPEAVAAIQEALRLAPKDGTIAFEASVVYALLGESDSAIANVERAVHLGAQKWLFSFPWFDPLRTRPDFQELVRF